MCSPFPRLADPTRPKTAIPWYVHPAENPIAWQNLPSLAPELSMIVLNVNNGPGQPDDYFYPSALAACGPLPWLGYVNLDYGRRPVSDVLKDTQSWRNLYGVKDFFLDCVPGPTDLRQSLTAVIHPLREESGTLVGNPGQPGDPELLDLFDVTVVVENSWDYYVEHASPEWHADVEPDRLWHLIHGCPPEQLGAAWDLAATRPVGHFFVTDRTLPNPWRGLPTPKDESCE